MLCILSDLINVYIVQNLYLHPHKCDRCNTHLSGNPIQYRIGLVEKIGEDKVKELEYNHDVKKWTREELDEIKETVS